MQIGRDEITEQKIELFSGIEQGWRFQAVSGCLVLVARRGQHGGDDLANCFLVIYYQNAL